MKNRHVVGSLPYFRASGPRKEFELDETSGTLRPTGRTFPEAIRFEALRLGDVEAFATDVYRREGIVLTLEEVPRG